MTHEEHKMRDREAKLLMAAALKVGAVVVDHRGARSAIHDTHYGTFLDNGWCMDCKRNTLAMGEHFMLEDAVWLEANPAGDGMLCIACTEARLGRRLVPADFHVGSLLNRADHADPKSWRFRDRLGLT